MSRYKTGFFLLAALALSGLLWKYVARSDTQALSEARTSATHAVGSLAQNATVKNYAAQVPERDSAAVQVNTPSTTSIARQTSAATNAFVTAQQKRDLFTAFINATNSGTPDDASTAAYLVSVCLPYASGSPKPYPLDTAHYEKLSAAGAAGRATNREHAAEKLFDRCKGFGDKARLAETMKVLSAQLTQAGVVGVFGQAANDSQRREAAATIEKVFQNPDSYLGVLMANTNEIFPRLGSALGDATTGAAESRLAFELGMCQLGSDCGRDSISAMNACIIIGVCTESTVQEKASQLARAYGFDFERIERMADAFAGGVRRADTSVLGYRR